MDGQLRAGTKLGAGKNAYTVKALLGAGGQGEVYRVSDSDGNEHALKWYFPKMATPEQKAILEKLVREGSPSSCFLWPEDFIQANGTYGYIMPLRPSNYSSIVDLVKRRAEPSFLNLCKAAYNLTKGYQQLHTCGFSYRDISFGNLFLDSNTGDVLICDNDNVSADDSGHFSVYGTPRFMAPEIVRGEAKPSRNTDRYSLAVLLFYMLMLNHPLEGALEFKIHCMDVQAMNKLYGTNPVFIFDPNDHSNLPVKGYQDNAHIFWQLYPQYLKDLFIKAFTVGLKDPTKRVTETEWMDAFANMISGIIKCPKCHAEVFYDPEIAEQGKTITCWGCNKSINMPKALKVKQQITAMVIGQELFSHQVDHINGNIEDVLGTVVSNPNDATQLGLRNESTTNWTYIRSDGSSTLVPPTKTARVAVGNTIDFGNEKGKFC